MRRVEMRADLRERGIAVVGSSMDALIQAYYLHRFGFEADVFLEDLDFPQFISDELVSTWLGLYSSPDMARIAGQGIAELRDIALDLGSAAVVLSSGTMIFERRPEHIAALEQFANSCRAKGLLVKYSTQVAHLDVPPFTLAIAKFDQDISVSLKRLAKLLIQSILLRGGRILRGRSFDDLHPMNGYYEAEINGEVLGYATVVMCKEMAIPRPGDTPSDVWDTWLPVTGRYLSFERALQLLAEDKSSAVNQGVSVIIDPIREFFSKDSASRRAPWPDTDRRTRDPKVIPLGPHLDVFHSVALARVFAESIQSCAHLGRIQPLESPELTCVDQPQSIPWII